MIEGTIMFTINAPWWLYLLIQNVAYAGLLHSLLWNQPIELLRCGP